jgi:hypothetical protein
MGFDHLRATRVDRGKRAPAFRIEFGEALSSERQTQIVILTESKTVQTILRKRYSGNEYSNLQHMVYALKASCRLNVHDITVFIEWWRREPSVQGDAGDMTSSSTPSRSTSRSLIIGHAEEAVKHYTDHWKRIIPTLSDSHALQELAAKLELSTCNRLLRDHWAVLVYSTNPQVLNELRKLQPSFFVPPPQNAKWHPQIHISTQPIKSARYPLLDFLLCSARRRRCQRSDKDNFHVRCTYASDS